MKKPVGEIAKKNFSNLACQHAFDMQIAGEVEEVAVFGGQSGYSIRTVSNMTSPFGRYCMSTL